VEDLSLTVLPGERHVIIGPNGAGKSTLLNLIGGDLRASSGRVFVHGVDVTRWAVHRRARLGLARTYQVSSLFPKLTVREHVRLGALARHDSRWHPFRPLSSYSHVSADVDAALERWQLSDYAAEKGGAISYGAQRRVEIAAALAALPSVLLLDEPTAGLSIAESEQVATLSRSLSRDVTVIMIEHDIDVVLAFADRITVMVNGGVILTGTPEEISASSIVQELYLGAIDG
jgi:branched-chain amino acid transport system ATP-binding protein